MSEYEETEARLSIIEDRIVASREAHYRFHEPSDEEIDAELGRRKQTERNMT